MWQFFSAQIELQYVLCMCLIWHSINESECKVKLHFDNFSARTCCFDDTCLIILHYYTLGWKWRFFFVWMIPPGKHFLLILLNNPNLPKIASIDKYLTCMLFFRFCERYDVIVTHYFTKVKCFSYRTLRKLVSYSDSSCCLLWLCSRAVKSCFYKKNCVCTQDARDIVYSFDCEK